MAFRGASTMPAAVARAYERVHLLVARDTNVSLEEMQGAVEYLLDKIRAARRGCLTGHDGSLRKGRANN